MKEQTYIRWPKPEGQTKKDKITNPDNYAAAERRNTTPVGDMICIGFSFGCNITTNVKIDIDDARLLVCSLRRIADGHDQPTMEKAAASTGF